MSELNPEKLQKFAKKGATATELKVFKIIVSKLEGAPFTVPELQKHFPRCKTSIKVHLKNMIEKGMIRRYARGLYVHKKPAVKTKKPSKRKVTK